MKPRSLRIFVEQKIRKKNLGPRTTAEKGRHTECERDLRQADRLREDEAGSGGRHRVGESTKEQVW